MRKSDNTPLPNAGYYCAKCGNRETSEFVFRGVRSGKRRFECQHCGAFGSVKVEPESTPYSYVKRGEFADIHLLCDKRIITEEDVVKLLHLDTAVWQVIEIRSGTSEGYRKDRKVDWLVKDGKVLSGEVHDSGKLLITSLYSVKVTLRRRTNNIRNRLALDDLRKDASKFAYHYKQTHYRKTTGAMLLEIGIPDLQLGRLVSAETAGRESSPDLSVARARQAVLTLLAYASGFKIDRILLPFGNDFFDANNAAGTTAHGTPQQDDVRWQRTYRMGRRIIVEIIDRLVEVAPVDVVIVPGNHDAERIFYIGDALTCWYRNSTNVKIDDRATTRKYYAYGKCLLGLTHGYSEKIEKLGALMPCEATELWSKSLHREFHLGHKHHKVDIKTDELNNGVVVRILRSLATPSTWEFDGGFVGSLQAAEAFLWDKERGIVAQFTAVV